MTSLTIPYKETQICARVDCKSLRKEDMRNKFWVVLNNGPSGNVNHPQMAALASFLTSFDFVVLRYSSKKVSKYNSINIRFQMDIFCEVVNFLYRTYKPKGIIVGGQSLGAKTAVLAASHHKAHEHISIFEKIIGVISLSYPLHKANKPDEPNEDLKQLQKPIFFLTGTKEERCRKDVLESILPDLKCQYKIHWLEGYNHNAKSNQNYREKIHYHAFSEISDWCLNICKAV